MRRLCIIIIFMGLNTLLAGPQYTDIQHSIVTVDFSKLNDKTISVDGSGKDWQGTLPAKKNSDTYDQDEYIWYDAYQDDLGDGDYQYPFHSDFGLHSADIEQFRVCQDISNIYLYLKCYTTNNVFRNAAVIGIDTDGTEDGDYDLRQGDGEDPEEGCTPELRSTGMKCDYTVFSILQGKFWWDWNAPASRITNNRVHAGFYSLKAVCQGGGGTIMLRSEDQSLVDMSKANNFKIWVYDTQGNNSLELALMDTDQRIEKYWSTTSATQNKWCLITIPLNQYTTLDMKYIKEIQIYEWNSGTYYFDDLYVDNTPYHTFENSSSKMWDHQGNYFKINGQAVNSREWELKIPKSIISDPKDNKWQFIVGTGYHEDGMFREIMPPNEGVAMEWWGIGGDGTWWDNTSPDPDVFDLIGADPDDQIKDFSGYKEVFSETQDNLESLNVNFIPNPFNPKQEESIISFSVPMTVYVQVNVMNLDGSKVKNLLDRTIAPFSSNDLYEINWNGRDESNTVLASGVYIVAVKFTAGENERTVYKYIKIWR